MSQYINHYTGARLRVTGAGNLRMKLYSLSETKEQDLALLPMASLTNRLGNRLANFNQERASLRIETTAINEYFVIQKILVFVKIVSTDYPS